ncbi:MAG: hypothetical protein GF364_07345 [Candidatus Lokiarchaeota archaeon]|nr:hypothetical protein [Candidatus Lokiarchaeota archaeon]
MAIISDDLKKKMKKSMGFVIMFFGFFLILIGFLFGFLFEIYGLFFIALAGGILLIIGIILFRSVKESLFDLSSFFSSKQKDKEKKCSNCSRMNVADAIVCSYCGQKFVDTEGQKMTTIRQSGNQKQICPNCHAELENNLQVCPYCGINLR